MFDDFHPEISILGFHPTKKGCLREQAALFIFCGDD